MGANTGLHRRLRALFEEALRKDPTARQTYLNEACADDPALQSQVLRLLDAHQKASSFLEQPVGLLALPVWADDDFSGTERFRVLRRIGAGGMGVVYEVEDFARGEIVALKTLRHATPAGIYRLARVPKPRRCGAPERGIRLMNSSSKALVACSRWSS